MASLRALRSHGAALAVLSLAFVPSVARAQLPPAPAHEVEPSDEARRYFQTGVELLQDPDGARYEEAFKSFRRAYEVSPSWKILGNLGLTALKLERSTEAIDAYERYLAAGGSQIDAGERQQVQRDLDIMKTSTGSVAVHMKDGSAVAINDTRQRAVGGPVVNAYQLAASQTLTLRLVAGHHVLAASAGGKQATVELDIQAGSKLDQELAFPEAPLPSAAPVAPPVGPTPAPTAPSSPPADQGGNSGLRTTGLIIGGVGAAALVGGAITGFIGLHKKSTLDGECPNSTCAYHSPSEQSSFNSDKDSLKTLGTVTTVFLIGGGVLAATGITLFVAGGSKHSEQVSLVTGFGPFGAGLAARGAF